MKRTLVILGLSCWLIIASFNGYALAQSSKSGGANRPSQSQGVSDKTVGKNDLPPQAKSVWIRGQGNSLQVKPLSEGGDELEFTEGDGVDSFILEEEGDGSEETEFEVKSKDNAALVIRNKLATQTHFPLMVNLETNELIVTTPKGQKVVTVLPDQAVANMLAANVLDQLGGKGGIKWLEQQEATASATPFATASATPSATASAEPSASPSAEVAEVQESAVVLTIDEEGELVYEISGVKFERLLGLIPVTLQRTAIVSTTTGELIAVDQSFFTRLVDLLSV